MHKEKRVVLPLSQRPLDIILLIFFVINILYITYMVDIEQLTIPKNVIENPDFEYPLWPPKWQVDIVHWWGRTFDRLVLARPVWWKVTIWTDSLFFGPFYIIAIYAFWYGKEWIRIPSIIYSSTIITIVITILSEEIWGPYSAQNLPIVLLANAPWLLCPLMLLIKMSLNPHPFTKEDKAKRV